MIPTTWEETDSVPAMGCNMFMIQSLPHEFLLVFGYAAPPLATRLEDVRSIPAKVVARVMLSPARIHELASVLHGFVEQLQQVAEQAGNRPH